MMLLAFSIGRSVRDREVDEGSMFRLIEVEQNVLTIEDTSNGRRYTVTVHAVINPDDAKE
jgi:hypothetical protein